MTTIQRQHLLVGTLCAVSAGLMWGLAFFIPKLLDGFSSIEVTLGRYAFYGMFSLGLLALRWKQLRLVTPRIWGIALLYALAGNVGYYLLLVLGIRLAGSTIATMIIATLPVTLTLYGNYVNREFPFRRLLLPVTLILLGILTLQMAETGLSVSHSGGTAYWLGVLCAVTALALWTWFGVSNARFLKRHQHVDSFLLITLIGVQTLVVTLLAVLVDWTLTRAFIPQLIDKPGLLPFLFYSFVLGVVVSWLAGWLWNIASSRLPVTLVGNLIVLETIFGLLYVYLYEHHLPQPLEVLSMMVFLTGLFLAINQHGKKARQERQDGKRPFPPPRLRSSPPAK